MARAYRDAQELAVTPVDRVTNPLVEEGAVILEGTRHPAAAGALPLLLAPGSEYLIRSIDVEGETIWTLSRRAAGPKRRLTVGNHDDDDG